MEQKILKCSSCGEVGHGRKTNKLCKNYKPPLKAQLKLEALESTFFSIVTGLNGFILPDYKLILLELIKDDVQVISRAMFEY